MNVALYGYEICAHPQLTSALLAVQLEESSVTRLTEHVFRFLSLFRARIFSVWIGH